MKRKESQFRIHKLKHIAYTGQWFISLYNKYKFILIYSTSVYRIQYIKAIKQYEYWYNKRLNNRKMIDNKIEIKKQHKKHLKN